MEEERYDVAVVGGGSAGIAAGIAAAELGANTVLLERADSLGGNISQALVHTICGLYHADDAGAARHANPGFSERFARVLKAAGAAGDPVRAGRVWVLPTDPPKLAASAAKLCRATPGLTLKTGHEVVAAALTAEGDEPQRLRWRDGAGRQADLSAALVVDASGDAVVAALGGADTEIADPDELQIPSYIFRLADVDATALVELGGFGRLRVTHAVAGAARSGELPPGCEAVLVRPGLDAGRVYVTLNVPRPEDRPYDPLDRACVADLQAQAQRAAKQVVEFLRRTRPAFEKCRVDGWPAHLGIRETHRICGRIDVSRDDICEGRRRPDEVALSTWPVERWSDHRRAHIVHPAGPCSIPLGALASRSHSRLAMAGRCLGADSEALGALRVIGTALAAGEAAGVAAALAADAGTSLAAVAPAKVRHHILERAGSATDAAAKG